MTLYAPAPALTRTCNRRSHRHSCNALSGCSFIGSGVPLVLDLHDNGGRRCRKCAHCSKRLVSREGFPSKPVTGEDRGDTGENREQHSPVPWPTFALLSSFALDSGIVQPQPH